MPKRKKQKKGTKSRQQKTRIQKQKRRQGKGKQSASRIQASAPGLPAEMSPEMLAHLDPEFASEVERLKEGDAVKPAKRGRGRPRKTPEQAKVNIRALHGDSFHPSLYQSRRFQQFNERVRAILNCLPAGQKSFDLKDIKDRELYAYLYRMTVRKEKDMLYPWQKTILTNAGYTWQRPAVEQADSRRWEEWIEAVKALPLVEGVRDIHARQNRKLAAWLDQQRKAHKLGKLPQAKQKVLEGLGIDLAKRSEADKRWKKYFKSYLAEKNGDKKDPPPSPAAQRSLKRWISQQRNLRAEGKLPDWRFKELDAIGFDWRRPGRGHGQTLAAIREVAQRTDGSFDFTAVKSPGQKAFLGKMRKLKKAGNIKPEIERTLNEMGFDWEAEIGELLILQRWREHLQTYADIKMEKGGKPPRTTDLSKHSGLLPWVNRMRKAYKDGALSKSWIEESKAAGFDYTSDRGIRDRWESHFRRLEAFKRKNGHLQIPFNNKHPEEKKLASWVVRQRSYLRAQKLSPEQAARLRQLGIQEKAEKRTPAGPRNWQRNFDQLRAFLEEKGDGRLSKHTQLEEPLKTWLEKQRWRHNRSLLPEERLEALVQLGFSRERTRPEKEIDWEKRLPELRAFRQRHGHTFVTESNAPRRLVAFVSGARTQFRRKQLSKAQIDALKAVDFVFDTMETPRPSWMAHYRRLKAYKAAHGNCAVPRQYPDDQELAEFVAQAKQRGRKGLLRAEHIRLLNELNFEWVVEPKAKSRPES